MDENVVTQQTLEGAAENTAAANEAAQGVGTVSDEQLAASQKLLEQLGFGDGKPQSDGNNKDDEAKEPEEKRYSQADLDAEVAKALAAKEEEARLAKLPEAERIKAQAESAQNEVAELKAQLLAKDLQQKAVTKLDKDGLPVKLAELLDYSSEDNMTKSLAAVTEVFKESLQTALLAKLKGKTPLGLGQNGSGEQSLQETIAKGIRGGL